MDALDGVCCWLQDFLCNRVFPPLIFSRLRTAIKSRLCSTGYHLCEEVLNRKIISDCTATSLLPSSSVIYHGSLFLFSVTLVGCSTYSSIQLKLCTHFHREHTFTAGGVTQVLQLGGRRCSVDQTRPSRQLITLFHFRFYSAENSFAGGVAHTAGHFVN